MNDYLNEINRADFEKIRQLFETNFGFKIVTDNYLLELIHQISIEYFTWVAESDDRTL